MSIHVPSNRGIGFRVEVVESTGSDPIAFDFFGRSRDAGEGVRLLIHRPETDRPHAIDLTPDNADELSLMSAHLAERVRSRKEGVR